MYYYIYDTFVLEKEYAKELAMIENRLTDFGINGHIGRLSLFRSAGELISDEILRGAKTIVVVGNDATVRKAIDAVTINKVALGIIPIGGTQTFAKLFGVPEGIAACDVLAKRRILNLDIGKINGRHFISRICIPSGKFTIKCDGKYEVSSVLPGQIQIRNIGWLKEHIEELGNPQDGYLEAIIDAPDENRWFRHSILRRSMIPVKKMTIVGEKIISGLVDEEKYSHERFEVSVLPKRLKVIVGKERMV